MLEDQQVSLLKAALQHGTITPSTPGLAHVPSIVRPQALADHAGKLGIKPIDDASQVALCARDDLAEPGSVVELSQMSKDQKVIDTVQFIGENGHGMHGFGDSEYGVSKAMVQHMLDHTEGFVSHGHQQLIANHGFISLKQPHLDFQKDLSAEDDLERLQCCEQEFGRYCRTDIDNLNLYNNAVELNKSVARLMQKKRTVKLGKNMYLAPSPDTFFPVLLIHAEETPGVDYFGFLAYRISFSPLEVDWIRCKVARVNDDDDAEFYLEPIVLQYPGTNNCHFETDHGNEFAVWFSLHYRETWKCRVFLTYSFKDNPVKLVLKASDESQDLMKLGISDQKDQPILKTKTTEEKEMSEAFSFIVESCFGRHSLQMLL